MLAAELPRHEHAARDERRALSDLYEWLLFGHILGAMLWVGGIAILTALGARVLRSDDPADLRRFVGSLRAVGPIVLAPAPILVVVLGVWMALDSDAWGFDQAWIGLGLALFVVVFLIGIAHQARAGIGAERAVADGDDGEAKRHLVRWLWGMRVILVLLLVATWDMVFRPGL